MPNDSAARLFLRARTGGPVFVVRALEVFQSVTEGLVLVMTSWVVWEYLIDWLTYRFAALRPVLRPPSLTMVKEGQIVEEAMRKEMLSIDELASQLRQQSRILRA